MSRSYKALFEPQDDGGFAAYGPDSQGCASEGETYDESVGEHPRADREPYRDAESGCLSAPEPPYHGRAMIEVKTARADSAFVIGARIIPHNQGESSNVD